MNPSVKPAVRPSRQTERLRIGRVSLPGACYFLTFCAAQRTRLLAISENARQVALAMEELSADADWVLLAATVMPDHVHVLFELGRRLPLARVLAKFKGRAWMPGARGLWQANAFEHRVRSGERLEDYAFYIFMNPYRAGLVGGEVVWPWWRTGEFAWQFEGGLSPLGAPPPEWQDLANQVEKRISVSPD